MFKVSFRSSPIRYAGVLAAAMSVGLAAAAAPASGASAARDRAAGGRAASDRPADPGSAKHAAKPAAPRAADTPEIFFIGDSHLSFGAGRAFQDFFRNFDAECTSEESWPGQAAAIAMRRFGLMGVKTTALHTWVSSHRSLKKLVCVPDPKWPVNARLYGFSHRTDGTYVQLGEDSSFPFCRPQQESALQAVFNWTEPRLLILFFMGNTIDRWANSPALAARDVKRLTSQLPDTTGCLFMTTSPVYRASHNAERLAAQRNIADAFAEHATRCTFLPMLTRETIAAIEGNVRYFRRHSNGRVKDPYHPNLAAARHLLRIQRKPLCRAVMESLRPELLATMKD